MSDLDPSPGPLAQPPWYRRPVPCVLVGGALLVVALLAAAAWLSGDVPFARPVGYVAGGAGIYLLYGGIVGLREERQ